MFDLKRPCAHCPFRRDVPGFLRGSRMKEICRSLIKRDEMFPCHETTTHTDDGKRVNRSDEQHCAGATIMLLKLRKANQIMRIAGRMGWFKPEEMDMQAPVFDTAREAVRHHEAAVDGIILGNKKSKSRA